MNVLVKPSPLATMLELVVFVWGEPQRYSLPQAGQLRIGRDKEVNDVAIADPSVSRRHAILQVKSNLVLQDLGSSNGTVLRKGEKDMESTTTREEKRFSGQTIEIEPGDRISFGSVMSIVRKVRPTQRSFARASSTWQHPAVVHDPAMRALHTRIREMATSSPRSCVLILGETGAGKEIVAESLHQVSPRAYGPFVTVPCSALSESLFERELFGHKRGAFTGALQDAKGYFESAHGGTLFLDEVGELPLTMQARLLRALDTRHINRVGDPEPIAVDVRIISATNRDLEECVERGTFRRDLFYRLRGSELKIPALRERPSEIIPLAQAFLADECEAIRQTFVPKLSPEVVDILLRYSFPGNLRELRNAMSEALAHCRTPAITQENLPPHILAQKPCLPHRVLAPLAGEAEASEKEQIERALYQAGGNHRRAADLLGCSLRTLQNRLNKYPEIPRPRKGPNSFKERTRTDEGT